MSRIALALALSALPAATLAQPAITCASFADSNAIPAPPDSLTDAAALQAVTSAFLPISFDIDLMADMPGGDALPLPEIRATGGCSLREMAMLTANFAAIDTAEPAADPAALAGTWVSDDMLLGASGAVVPGQEVLVIGDPVPDAGDPRAVPPAGSLPVSQYWFHGFIPETQPVWNEKDEYYGLIVSGHLAPDGAGGYGARNIPPLLDYAGITILPERTEDLFLKSRLNLFQRDVGLALAQDTLVLTYDAPIPIARTWSERIRTYHRVSPGAPEAALRMLRGAGLPMTPNFNCLALKISAEDPALLAAIAPMTLAEFDALQRQADQWDRQRTALQKSAESGGDDAGPSQEFIDGMQRMALVYPKLKQAGEAIRSAQLCPAPPLFGLR